ncbi:MAG: hypothetical protein AAB815_00770 [Patescibacteria group bacterium]
MEEPKISIQKIVDDAIALENAEPRTPSGLYNPSYLGLCYRKHYWKRKGEIQSNPPDARSFRVFKCGHLFEWFVTKEIPAQQQQVMVKTDDFVGYADIVTDDEVMDVKSINSKAFWYMDKETYDINKEKRQNILQVVFYAKVLGKPKARLVFVSKDDLCIREYGFFVSAWEVELDKEIATLKKIWAKDELPEADPQMKWECGYCPFKDKCKSTGGKVWENNA